MFPSSSLLGYGRKQRLDRSATFLRLWSMPVLTHWTTSFPISLRWRKLPMCALLRPGHCRPTCRRREPRLPSEDGRAPEADLRLISCMAAPKKMINTATGQSVISAPGPRFIYLDSGVPVHRRRKLPNASAWQIQRSTNCQSSRLSVRYVCANRSASTNASAGVYGVGGWVDVAIVQEDGIFTHIAHHWPDKIGEVIDPSRGDPLPIEYG